MPKRSIYAVIAAINAYNPPVTALRGCIHDAGVWEAYLNKEKDDHDVHIHMLQDAEVTKQALTDAIRESLTNTGKGDIFFFYYSGHGTRETADPVFSDIEQDKALESLVCHDSIIYQRGDFVYNLLSDKELHYLLSAHGKEGAHILTVFDCCHTGSITRNMFAAEQNGTALERKYIPTERMSFIAPMRRWNQFLFAENITRDQVEEKGWMKVVPQRRHVTLSACQNDESAYEQNGRGIFTDNMHEVLKRSGGALSYYDLQSRVRLFTQNQFRQTPEVYAIKGYEDDPLKTFLDKTAVQKDFGCTCYKKKGVGWVVDLGAIHGVSAYSGPVEIIDGKKRHGVSIDTVFGHYSSLKIPAKLLKELNDDEAYSATIKAHFSGNTAFNIEAKGDQKKILDSVLKESEAYIKEHRSPFAISDSRANASYLVRPDKQKIRICNSDDAKRPVTEISLNDADPVNRTLQFMSHIAQWEYIRTLCNPDFKTTTYPVEFALFRILPDGSRKELQIKGDTIEFEYDHDKNDQYSGHIKVQLTNKSKAKYYCAILYLSNEFQVYGNMLDGKVVGLNPDEDVWIQNGDALELDLEQHVVDFNYPHSIFYLKLLANPEPFQVDTLEQSGIPAPVDDTKRGFDDTTASKGLKTREEKAVKDAQWFTRTLCFKGRNPFFKDKKP